jgi:hypothetical protein
MVHSGVGTMKWIGCAEGSKLKSHSSDESRVIQSITKDIKRGYSTKPNTD